MDVEWALLIVIAFVMLATLLPSRPKHGKPMELDLTMLWRKRR